MQILLDKADRSSLERKSEIMEMLYSRDDYHALFDIRYDPVNLDTEDENGFKALFNNVNLTGWMGDTKGYVVEEGKIICVPGGNLLTEKEYSDFVLRFEFKLPPGGNNGLAIRTPVSSNAAYDGIEIQILDTPAEMYKNIKPWQAHGSIYGIVPAKRGFLRPVGQWNQEEVIAVGRQVQVKLNGEIIVNADLDKASTPSTMDGKNHPGLKNKIGHIGFLGHGSRVEFRNIRIKEINTGELVGR